MLSDIGSNENKIMSRLIKPITSDHDLIELAKQIGVHLDAIYESNEIIKPISKRGTYLILLRTPDRDIGHWTCVYNGEYFDSMGEAGPTKYGIGKYNSKQFQGTYGDYCGVWCMLWLYCKQKKRMDLLNRFKDLNLTIL